jgi:hypothetical protein
VSWKNFGEEKGMKKIALLTLIALFILIALSLHGQDSHGRKWEYLVARGCGSSSEANDRVCKIGPTPPYHAVSTMTLNEIGGDGWELVSALPTGNLIFKRSD